MKQHRILKNFTGSQTGIDYHSFVAGTEKPLSASLAEQAVKHGWAEPVEQVDTKAEETTANEEKATDSAPENKAKKAPSNKGKKAA